MYSEEDRRLAVDLWYEMYGTISMADFCAELGWPSETTLAKWARADPRWDPDRPQHRSVSMLAKLMAVEMVAGGASWATAGRAAGVSASEVGKLVGRYRGGGTAALLPQRRPTKMGKPGKKREPYAQPPEVPGELPDDPAALKAIVRELQLDNALLREVLDVLKADPGCVPSALTNREKATVAERLSRRFGAAAACARLGLARSTYYHQLGAMTRPDPDAALDAAVLEAFAGRGRSARGYRFVHEAVAREMGTVSEKRVLRSMRRQGLRPVWLRRRRRWSSYAGETDGGAPNLLLRGDGTHDFRPAAPNEAWASDITEFRLPCGRKVYLSVVVDLFDTRPCGWALGTSPDADLADSSLLDACRCLRPGDAPLVHTDRGAHYRWPGWKRICAEFGLARSMSRKGRSPDNAACEGFFGTFKNEVFHGRDWSGWTADEFIVLLDAHLGEWRAARLRAFREGDRTVYDTIDGRRARLGYAATLGVQ
jgi:transposase InsO family protein